MRCIYLSKSWISFNCFHECLLRYAKQGEFIKDTENHYPGLKRMADWELIFSVIMQETKVKYGIPLIKQFKDEINNNTDKKRIAKKYGLTNNRINDFLTEIENEGVLTKRMVFAALRYERWLELNQNATLKARTTILQELYQDYKLGELLTVYPETRVRFFLMTCLKDSNEMMHSLDVIKKPFKAYMQLREKLTGEKDTYEEENLLK